MKSSVLFMSCSVLVSLVTGACGSNDSETSTQKGILDWTKSSECATAGALKDGTSPLYWPFWRTRSWDEYYQADEKTGYGLEITEEIIKDPIPGSGTGILKQKTCSRAFTLKGSKKVYLESQRLPGSMLVAAVRSDAGYILLTGQIGVKDKARIEASSLDLASGQRRLLASEPVPTDGCNASIGPVPSPSGRYILIERLQPESCGPDEPRYDITVTIFDSKGVSIGSPIQKNVTGGSQLIWLSETEFELKDNEGSEIHTVPGV
ncbi:MAG TPA: hypothetical protein VE954_06940 [Oligoflexus sp.]|uniref:hypothetical protein n=1 Tax=Oligoflexus sp. TaxID=1971216 RepID=UPI002D75D3F4|nr:hypothetical protein [Oligoflexus sp.]HYX32833.1 hypothetical protein [Oligoflexus sp.]